MMKNITKLAVAWIISAFLSSILTGCNFVSRTDIPDSVTTDVVHISTSEPTLPQNLVTPEEDLVALIAEAEDGDVLYLAEGTFNLKEGIVIQKSITLIGSGVENTFISGANTATYLKDKVSLVHFDASGGSLTLTNLTLAYEGIDPSNLLRINNGELTLKDCRLKGPVPMPDGSTTYDLVLSTSATAQIENCTFEGNPDAPDGNPSSAIRLQGSAHLDLRQSTIQNVDFGIELTDASTAEISGNSFSVVNKNAISFYGESSGSVTGNTFNRMKYGVVINEKGRPTITGNQFFDPQQVAIYSRGESVLSAVDNTISGSVEYFGIVCNETSSADLEGNTIEYPKVGIVFMGSSSGQARNNEIKSFSSHGIEVSESSTPTLEENRIQGRDMEDNIIGILFIDHTSGKALKNHISSVQLGIQISDQASLQIQENRIENAKFAMIAYDNSQVDVNHNTLSNNQTGIVAYAKAAAQINNNVISGLGPNVSDQYLYYGITFNEDSSGSIEGNTVEKYDGGIQIATSQTITATGNKISGNQDGMLFFNEAGGIARKNEIFENNTGISILKGCTPTVEENVISRNKYGIWSNSSNNLDLENNTFNDNYGQDIKVGST